MISFYFETDFKLDQPENVSAWLEELIQCEQLKVGEISYIFCDDEYLLEINRKYLNHSALTDVISFENNVGNLVSGDIYISIPRVQENSVLFETSFKDELHRVIEHGVLHFCGYADKKEEDKRIMREKEDYYLSLRTF